MRFFFQFVLLICTRIWRKFPEILARRRRRQIFRRFFIKENPLFLGVLAKDFFNSTLKNEKNRLRRTLFLWNPISFWNVGQKNEGASRILKSWLSNRWCFLWSIIYVINICNSIISTLLILIFALVALVDVLLFVWECWHRFVVIISELSSLVRSILFSEFLPKFIIVKTSHKICFLKEYKTIFPIGLEPMIMIAFSHHLFESFCGDRRNAGAEALLE